MTAGTPAPRVLRNAALKGVVQGTRALSLLYLVLAARALGPEAFGRFTFAYVLATLLGAGLDLGMHPLVVRAVARAPEEAVRAWRAAATLKLGLLPAVGGVFALLPLALGRPADTVGAAWLLGCALVVQSFVEVVVSLFTGVERLEWELRLRVVEKLILLAAGLPGLLWGDLWLVAGAFVVAALGALGLGLGLVHRHLGPLRCALDPVGARALGRALRPVAAAFVLAFTTTRLPPLLVALLAGDEAAGYLGAAVRVLDVTQVVPVATLAGVYPLLARIPARDPGFRRFFVGAGEGLLAVGLGIALALGHGAEWLTRFVYGARYAATAPLLASLGIAVCLGFLNQFLGTVFLAVDRPRRLLVVTAVGCSASAGLTPGLVLATGAAGGAAALVLVELLTLAAGLVALAPFTGLPFGSRAWGIGGAALGAGLVGGWLPPGGLRLGGTLLAYGVALVALAPPCRGLRRGAGTRRPAP